jgi:hypothetical protein
LRLCFLSSAPIIPLSHSSGRGDRRQQRLRQGHIRLENYPSQLQAALNACEPECQRKQWRHQRRHQYCGRLDLYCPSGTRVAVIWIGINDIRRGVSMAEVQPTSRALSVASRAKWARRAV